MNEVLEATFVVYYIFLVASVALNLAALIYLIHFTSQRGLRLFSALLLYLHFSLIAEELTTIPFIYKYNDNLCIAIEGLKFYFGLKNVSTILCLVRAYSSYIQKSANFYFPNRYVPHLQLFLSVFPMIAFLPYTDGTYIDTDDAWCSLPTTRSLVWEIVVQYLWVWIMLFYTVMINIRILKQLYYNYDSLLLNQYIANVVPYSFLAWVTWIPRTVIRFSYYHSEADTQLKFISYFPMYIAGILFAVLFFNNIPNIVKFEQIMDQNNQSDFTGNSVDWTAVFDRNSQLVSSGESKSRSNASFDFRADSRASKSIFSPLFSVDYGLAFGTKSMSNRPTSTGSDKAKVELHGRESSHA